MAEVQTQQQQHQPRIPVALQAVFLASNQGQVVDTPPEGGEAFKVFERPSHYSYKNPFRGVFTRRGYNNNNHNNINNNNNAYNNNDRKNNSDQYQRQWDHSGRPIADVGISIGNDDNRNLTSRSRLFFSRRTRRRDDIPQYNQQQHQQQQHQQQQQQQQQQQFDSNHGMKIDPESSNHQRMRRNADNSTHHRRGLLGSSPDNTPHDPSYPFPEKDYRQANQARGPLQSLRDRLNVFKKKNNTSARFRDNNRHDSISGKEFYFGTNTNIQGDHSFSGVTGATTADQSTLHQQLQRQYAVDDISPTSSVNLDDTEFTSHSRSLHNPSTSVRRSATATTPATPPYIKSTPSSSKLQNTSTNNVEDGEVSNYSRAESTTKKKKVKKNPSLTPSAASVLQKGSVSSVNQADRSLQGFFDRLISARGYSTDTYSTLETGYHNDSTPLQEASYTSYTVSAAKNGDAANLRRLLKCGLSPNPANYYGESLMHIVCRNGSHEMLQIMLECGATVQVSDDVGRTPLHNACWAKVPSFATVELLLQRDVFLMHLRDARGSTPLEYVRKEHWPAWISFFLAKKNKYWPVRVPEIVGRQQVPVLIRIPPNTIPVLDPPNALNLALARMVAKGTMEPEDAMLLQSGDLGDGDEGVDDDDDDEDDDDDDDEDDDDDDEDDDDNDGEEDSGSVQSSFEESAMYSNSKSKKKHEEKVVESVPPNKKKGAHGSNIDETRFFSSKDSIYGDNNSSHTSLLRKLMMFDDEDEDDMLLDEMLRRVATSKQRQREGKKSKK